MSKQLKDDYEQSQRDLLAKQQIIRRLQQQKSELENVGRGLQEITELNNQIQSLQGELTRLQPEHDRLQKEYNQTLQTNQNLNSQIDNLSQQLNQSIGQKNIYDNFFASIDSILGKYSEFSGQRIDPVKMVVQLLPKSEMQNSTALKDACEKQSEEAFSELLKKMSDINAVDSQGMTLLMYSLKHGFWYGVEKLLSLRADVDMTDSNGVNAVIYACTMPHMKSVTKIIERSSNINLQIPNTGDTALHCLLKNVGIDKTWSDEIEIINQTLPLEERTNDIYFTGTLIINENTTFVKL